MNYNTKLKWFWLIYLCFALSLSIQMRNNFLSDDLFFFVFVLYYIRFCFCFCICFSLTLPILYRYVCSFFICSENSFLMPTYVFHNLKHFYFFVLILLKTQEMYKFLEKHSCLINSKHVKSAFCLNYSANECHEIFN